MRKQFQPEKWRQRTSQTLQAGRAFGSLILDVKQALEEQVPNGDIPTYAEQELSKTEWLSAWPEEPKQVELPWIPRHDLEALLGEFDALFRANQIYCTQAVVHASTLAEGMIVEFLTVLFENRTEKMYSFTGHEGLKGQISLKIVSQSESLQELLNSLATQAAARVFQQPYPKMLKTLERLSGVQFSPKYLREDLLSIFNLRNTVVHDSDSPLVSMSEARTAIWTIDKLNEYLLHSSMMNEFPVSQEAFSNEERENNQVKLAWRHEGEWPGTMKWTQIREEHLRPEVLKRFGENIMEDVPWERGAADFQAESLLREATNYLKSDYDLDTTERSVWSHRFGYARCLGEESLRAIAEGSMPFPEPTETDDED